MILKILSLVVGNFILLSSKRTRKSKQCVHRSKKPSAYFYGIFTRDK